MINVLWLSDLIAARCRRRRHHYYYGKYFGHFGLSLGRYQLRQRHSNYSITVVFANSVRRKKVCKQCDQLCWSKSVLQMLPKIAVFT